VEAGGSAMPGLVLGGAAAHPSRKAARAVETIIDFKDLNITIDISRRFFPQVKLFL
jgi:hypothetical protein